MSTATKEKPVEKLRPFTVVARDVINASWPVAPKVKTNPDDSIHFVPIKWILKHDHFFVAITRESPSSVKWRLRVWVYETDEVRLIADESGFLTVRGGEWRALAALRRYTGQPLALRRDKEL